MLDTIDFNVFWNSQPIETCFGKLFENRKKYFFVGIHNHVTDTI